jgi:Domain of unknown function (DUF4404)
MAEPTPQQPPSSEPIHSSLHELAEALRSGNQLTPEGQAVLADLVDELSEAVQPGPPSEAARHLAQSAAGLAHALVTQQSPGVVTAARDRLAAAALRVEAEAPLAAGFAQRILDVLANWGI